ncbi:sugar ABC transporter permease [Arthrobacter cheniae]|uniref:Sugar ABC transporter permease n=1 Tax=Arthrobacter cheniae TaxID=1258888 RepID=A0A3A5M5H5_9MICC|nr:sugar ABC transporter permease [Arthrobacter cheniae]RJT81794.1 sugar ABC transporter permease [Arthrobacter cheniae]
MSPTLLIVLAVVVLPLLWSVLIAFQQLRLLEIGTASPFRSLSLDNFERVFASGELWTSLGTTLVYTAGSVILSISLGLIAAMAVRKPFRGRTFVRAALLLPYVAPVVAVTFVWRTMLSPQFGIINEAGQSLFGWAQPIPFLSEAQRTLGAFGAEFPIPTALLTAIAFEGWRYFPFAFLFLMARLGALSAETEEAALVDGASPLQSFRYIVLPQLMPVIALLAILRTIWTFNEFDDIFLLTGGAAGTGVASVRVYEFLTVQRNVGAASAQSLVLSLVLILMLAIYMVLLRKRGERL